jgi:hypothetical protein
MSGRMPPSGIRGKLVPSTFLPTCQAQRQREIYFKISRDNFPALWQMNSL